MAGVELWPGQRSWIWTFSIFDLHHCRLMLVPGPSRAFANAS
jgi:hypothetical protein